MPSNDQDLARLYAEYLAQQTPPTYDDGASLLRGNPMALEVGLFGKGPKPKPVAPPVDIQRRRLLGLKDIPEQKPNTQLPAISTPSSVAPAPTPAQAPLSSMAYKSLTTPMSRRQFLGNTARTAGQMALRGAMPELAKLAETSQQFPLQEATNASPKDRHKTSKTLREILKQRFEYEPLDSAHGTIENHINLFSILQHHLPENLRNTPAIKALEQRNLEISKIIEDTRDATTSEELAPYFDAMDELRTTHPSIVDYVPEDKLFDALIDTGEHVDRSSDEEGDFEDPYDLGRALILHGHKPKAVLKYMQEYIPGLDDDPEFAQDYLQFLKDVESED